MGSVKGISSSNIQVSNVSIPINIDQYYCDKGKCSNRTSAVAISDVTFKKIRGTYIDKALYLACSDNVPCTDLSLVDIKLCPVKAEISHNSFCWSSYGQSEHNNLYLRKWFSARATPALGDYRTKFLNIHELQIPQQLWLFKNRLIQQSHYSQLILKEKFAEFPLNLHAQN